MIDRILNPWRLRVYPWAALATVTLSFVFVLFASKDLVTPQGVPLGGDYPVFYGVGSLILDGRYTDVFEVSEVNAAQARALGKPELERYHAWVYPPYVALLLAPLALPPYVPSFLIHTGLMAIAVWVAVGFVGTADPWVARHRGPIFAMILSFYPLLRAVTGGQNTAVSLLLICGLAATLARGRNVAAGVFLGLLMFKPHFAVPFIGLIIIARRWTTAGIAMLITVLYCVAAMPFFGADWVQSWLMSIASYREMEGNVNGHNLISFLGVAEQLWGPGKPLAWMAAALPCLAVIGFLCYLFWSKVRRGELVLESCAVAAAAVILISPHSQFYELGLVALPLILLVSRQKMDAAPVVIVIWVAAWIHALLDEPLVQPLFFLALVSFAASLRLIRPSDACAPAAKSGRVFLS